MKRELFKIYLLSLFLVLALFSCADQEIEIPQIIDDQNLLSLTYTIDNSTPITYATLPSKEHECDLQDVYVLFFSTVGGKKYAGYSHTSINKKDVTGSATLVVPASIKITDTWDILCIANLDDYANLGTGSTDTKTWLNSKLNDKTLVEAESILSIVADKPTGIQAPLPMSGVAIKPAGINKLKVDLKRRVARIDVEMASTVSNFVLESAQLWNARTKTDFSNANVSFAGGLPGEYAHYTGNVATTTNNVITAQLYAFPNRVMVPIANDKQTTCLIIGGRYASSANTTYYRINISKPRVGTAPLQPHHLKANSAYKIKIKSVEGVGDATAEEAYDNSLMQIDYRILDWDQPVLMMPSSDSYGNKLSVAQNEVLFPFYQGAEFILDVHTELSTTNPISASLLPALSGEDADKFEVEEILPSSSPKKLRIKTKNDNGSENDYRAFLILNWGGLQQAVVLQQATGAKSDIEAIPSTRILPVDGGEGEVSVNFKRAFSSFVPANLNFEILEPANTWLKVESPNYDPVNNKITYTFKADPLPADVDVRYVDVKFTLTGIGSGTTTVRASQSRYHGLTNLPGVRDIKFKMFERVFDKDHTLAAVYVDKGLTPDSYIKFKGFDSKKLKQDCLQFALNDKEHTYFELNIESNLPWKILPDVKVKQLISFTGSLQGTDKKLQGGALNPVAVEKVYIKANRDLSENINFVSWGGSFKILFDDGEEHEYLIFQEGCFQELSFVDADDLGTYFYGVSTLFDDWALDRYLGATSNNWFDKSENEGDLTAYTIVRTSPNPENAHSFYWSSVDCPRGFRLLNSDEFEYFVRNISQKSSTDARPNALYIPGVNEIEDYYVSRIAENSAIVYNADLWSLLRLFKTVPFPKFFDTAAYSSHDVPKENTVALCVRDEWFYKTKQ